MSINVSKRTIGINFNDDGMARAVVWAPTATKVHLAVEKEKIPLEKTDYGYWKAVTDRLKPGSLYKIAIDDGELYPDPASLSQPAGVHEHSAAFDLHNFKWTDEEWKNIPLQDYIIYELHTGAFTPENDFKGIIDKLDYLRDLGITAIEILPVGQFAGVRNWGYDGVYPFAVQHSYGGPRALQQLVNECHKKKIAVILDVIYNHIGPEGNYLDRFGPYFTDKYRTPWGRAINFDGAWCDGVRDYVIENVLMWFRDFHIDALRMDAVHAIYDNGPVHMVKAIKEKVNELRNLTNNPGYLITEMDLNDPVFINPLEKCGYGADAQWIDEFHHALRVAAGQKPEGYYSDFNGLPALAKSYRDAYVYDGQFSEHRKKFFGRKTNNEGYQFVVFSQNHDQIGNRRLGERSSALVSFEMCKLMAAAVLFAPYLPMLFMGEEWAEPNPFLFFIDHTDSELALRVVEGRKNEFSAFQWQGDPPDPRKEETFNRSLLQWNLHKSEPHATMLRYYKQLISLRKTQPALRSTIRKNTTVTEHGQTGTLLLTRTSPEQTVWCLMNFSSTEQTFQLNTEGTTELLDSSLKEWNGPGNENEKDKHKLVLQPESIRLLVRNET